MASRTGDLVEGDRTIMRVELSDGTWVAIEASGPLNATTAEELLEYVMLYERMLRKCAAAEAQGDPAIALLEQIEHTADMNHALGEHARIERALVHRAREILAQRRDKKSGEKP